MATGWWAALRTWGRPEPEHLPERPPQQSDRVPPGSARPVPVVDEEPQHDPAGAVPAAPPPSRGPEHDQPTGNTGSTPDPVRRNPTTTGAPPVAQLDNVIADLLAIEGATGAAIVDIDSGMALAAGGNPGFDLNVAAAGNSNVVRAKLRTISDLELADEIEDVLITLKGQYHLINVLKGQGNAGLFIYLVLSRTTANLALARHKLRSVAGAVSV